MPGRGEDGARVELGAGGRRADRQALALEVGQRLDAGFLRWRRSGCSSDRSRRCRAACRACPGKPASVLPSQPSLTRIAEREGDLALALLQQVEVLDRGLGRLHLRARAFDALGVDFRQRDAERIIDARRAAGQHVDEFLRLGRAPPRHSAATPAARTRVPGFRSSVELPWPARSVPGALSLPT